MLVEQKLKEARNSGFTLIELLVVTVVIVALMGVIFRLTGIAGSASERETTVFRMQCVENCLSGYYAAFGSYPPVPLQNASRSIYRKTDDNSSWIQSDKKTDTDDSDEKFQEYDQVEAACKAQPVAAMYPPPAKIGNQTSKDAYDSYQQAVQNALAEGVFEDEDDVKRVQNWVDRSLDNLSYNPGPVSGHKEKTSFNQLQLFRFGLMSFLLPRYRFMLDCAAGNEGRDWREALDEFRQWTDNNYLPPRMDTGMSYPSWADFCETIGEDDDWKIDLIPSQAACARWMPNLKDEVVTGPERKFFGVTVGRYGVIPDIKSAPSFALYSPGGYGSASSGRGYPLNRYTVVDGWGKDLFYYSPAPYQMYVLWSAGKNKKTFPPWVDLEQFKKDHPAQYSKAVEWMSDDIKYMSTGK